MDNRILLLGADIRIHSTHSYTKMTIFMHIYGTFTHILYTSCCKRGESYTQYKLKFHLAQK